MKMITKIAAVAAVMFMGAFSFAEGYMCANDLEPGEITEVTQEEDGFVLNANSEKNLTVEKKPLHKTKDGSIEFTAAVKLNGSGKPDYRSISFPAKAGETVTIWGNSGSKTEVRPLVCVDAEGKTVKELPMDVDGQAGTIASEGSFKAPADGVYTVYSKKSGINIYQISVGK